LALELRHDSLDCVQAQPFGPAENNEDFGERPTVSLVAWGAVIAEKHFQNN
jgi:hypothetical protein